MLMVDNKQEEILQEKSIVFSTSFQNCYLLPHEDCQIFNTNYVMSMKYSLPVSSITQFEEITK